MSNRLKFVVALLLVAAIVSVAAAVAVGDCAASDAALLLKRETWCASIVGWNCPYCPSPQNMSNNVKKDWPSQVTYFYDILNFLMNGTSLECLNTTYGADTANWIDKIQSNVSLGGTLLQTWAAPDGQPNYYEMPRKPGERIETPWTLGMKCWAFSYLQQIWANTNPLVARMASAGLDISFFAAQYLKAGPFSFTLCEEVMANCFVNASYDPKRNGTCPLSILEFKAGFGWQNLQHGEPIKYPYW